MRRAYRKAENNPNLAALFYAVAILLVLSAPAMVIRYMSTRK
jgi:hypothetical protein